MQACTNWTGIYRERSPSTADWSRPNDGTLSPCLTKVIHTDRQTDRHTNTTHKRCIHRHTYIHAPAYKYASTKTHTLAHRHTHTDTHAHTQCTRQATGCYNVWDGCPGTSVKTTHQHNCLLRNTVSCSEQIAGTISTSKLQQEKAQECIKCYLSGTVGPGGQTAHLNYQVFLPELHAEG